MKFARVKKRFPLLTDADSVKIGQDQLLKPIHKDNKYLASAGETITEKIIENLTRKERRNLWICRPYTTWLSIPEVRAHGLNPRQTIELGPDSGKVTRKLAGITRPAWLRELVDCLLSELEAGEGLNECRRSLSELKSREGELLETLLKQQNSYLNQALTSEIGKLLSRSSFEPEDFAIPSRQQNLLGDFLDFIFELFTSRAELTENLVQSDSPGVFKKIQGMLNRFDEEPARPSLVETIQVHALRSSEAPGLDQQSDIARELLEPVNQEPGLEEIQTLYECADDLFNAVVNWQAYYPHLTKRLRDRLDEVIDLLPDPHWALAETSAQGNSLVTQGINRLIFYSQAWPGEVLDQECLNRLPAILFREVGLLEQPRLTGRAHRVLSDNRTSDSEISSLYRDSVDVLKKVKAFPPEALEIIRAQTEKSGPDSEWVIREARRIDVCSGYDSLTTEWPWRKAETPGRAFNLLWNYADEYGPELLNHFCSGVGLFPSGITGRLTNDELCFVESQTDDPELPVVRRVTKQPGDKLVVEEEIDLRESKLSVGEVPGGRIAPWSKRRARLLELE